MDCNIYCPDDCCSPCHNDEGTQSCRKYESLELSWYQPIEQTSIIHGCDWLELNDVPGCREFGNTMIGYNGATASNGCCYCGCEDFQGYLDSYGDGCDWSEAYEDMGCPIYGDILNANLISPNDACCWCKGGYTSNDILPSVFPSSLLMPSSSPSISISPTYSAQPTIHCTDFDGWVDDWGDGCSFYQEYDVAGCPFYGSDNGATPDAQYINAWSACCHCGGGVSDGKASSSPSISKSPMYSVSPSSTPCSDFDGWIDNLDNVCSWYEDYGRCVTYGDIYYSIDLVFALDACCICGGGIKKVDPSINSDRSEVATQNATCSNLQIPRPWPDRDCDWFQMDAETRCIEFGADTFYKFNDETIMTALDVCCSCGGGTSDCSDFPGWIDSHSHQPFTCLDFDRNEECSNTGSMYSNLGHDANSACCVCGKYII